MRKLSISMIASIACFVLMLGVLSFMATEAHSAPTVWKLNAAFLASHVSHPALEWASKEVAKRSNGQLIIDIYPSFGLGFKPSTWYRDHKDGLIDISAMINMFTCGEEQSFCILEADCLAKTVESRMKAAEAMFNFKKKVYKDVWNSELIAAGYFPSKTSVVATKGKPVKTPEDLKGLKLRAPNARFKELLESFGAAPQFMPKTELYMAMKTGVLDGFGSGYGSLYTEKLFEVFDYAVHIGVSAACQLDIVASHRVWDPLPADLKKIVHDVFGEWVVRTKNDSFSGRVDNEDKALLEKAGKISSEFSEADKIRMADMAFKLNGAWVQSQGGRVAEAWEIVKPILTK